MIGAGYTVVLVLIGEKGFFAFYLRNTEETPDVEILNPIISLEWTSEIFRTKLGF